MIKEIILFTNRNTMFSDENGEQMPQHQSAIGFSAISDYDSKAINVMEQIIKEQPTIRLSKWNEWVKPLTTEEFFCLIGFGEWYWKRSRNQAEGEVL